MRFVLATIVLVCLTATGLAAPHDSTRIKVGVVYFAPGGTQPVPQAHDEISRMANAIDSFITYYGEGTIVVEGHTDSRGGHTANLNIGESRAVVIRELLTKQGVDYKRIRVVTHGEDNPIGDNRTQEGRARNRRAEVYLVR